MKRQEQPPYCEYASGACDYTFSLAEDCRALFLYPSKPQPIARTIENAVEQLRAEQGGDWKTWKNLEAAGQIIFCSICEGIRFSRLMVCDVSTLNFNLMFEIGFGMGLGVPVLPIRDTTYVRDKSDFDEFALLDVVGYLDFQNSTELVKQVSSNLSPQAQILPNVPLNQESPIYFLKGPISTEGAIRLQSRLKKSPIRFRTHDPVETPRLSLHEARKQIASSYGLIGHLLSEERKGARPHNAQCAFLAGMATAAQKRVLLVKEERTKQPIDYRDIVVCYDDPNRVDNLPERFLVSVIEDLQTVQRSEVKRPRRFLEQLDLGDVAAENEIRPLREYFVPTAQYNDARRGYSRLVIGRKGAGKTAIFYSVRDSFHSRRRTHFVLDLKPEGHQFTRLREAVLQKLSPGRQEHTLTAFWNYILHCELAHKIHEDERSWADRDPSRLSRYEAVSSVYEKLRQADEGDFSARLLSRVDSLASQVAGIDLEKEPEKLTEVLYSHEMREMADAVGAYLSEKEDVWLLFDNLDKGWPLRQSTSEQILILRALLEATRKLQRQFDKRSVNFHSLVFLRNDIYEHLLEQTPDKGKDSAIVLDWNDAEVFKEIIRRRVIATTGKDTAFEQVWSDIAEPHVDAESSFHYIVSRTLMRPRDLLNFVRRAIETAVNRGHSKVTADDIRTSETSYSEDLLLAMEWELRDVDPSFQNMVYEFLGAKSVLSPEEVRDLVAKRLPDESSVERGIELLAWFGFLGVQQPEKPDAMYSYEVRYNLSKLMAPVRQGKAAFVIHPAFRAALECGS
jgi:hypothetical protein